MPGFVQLFVFYFVYRSRIGAGIDSWLQNLVTDAVLRHIQTYCAMFIFTVLWQASGERAEHFRVLEGVPFSPPPGRVVFP